MRWNVHPRLSDTVALVRATQAKNRDPGVLRPSQLAALATALHRRASRWTDAHCFRQPVKIH